MKGKFSKKYLYGMTSGRRSKKVGLECEIVGETTDTRCFKVIWPGSRTPTTYHKSFIEIIDKPQTLMDKQQAADEFYEKHFCESPVTKPNAFIAGWEAREAQSLPTDAVAFGEFLKKFAPIEIADRQVKWWDKVIGGKKYTTEELYNLFNPSGAAPLDIKRSGHSGVDYENRPLDEIPLPAGPVWVKATTQKPVATKDRQKLSIKYKGSPDVLIFLNDKWHWWDDLHDKLNPSIDSIYIVNNDSWSAIEWLDESPQQLFTREQVRQIAGLSQLNKWDATQFDQYMNTNYPEK